MSDFDFADFELDLSPREAEKASRPLWYHDHDVADSYKKIVDVALQGFEDKLKFIQGLKSADKVNIKDWKLVAATLNKEAGLNEGYLRNKNRRDVRRTVDFITTLNERLKATLDARKVANVRPSVSDRKAAYAELLKKFRRLEQMQLSEYAKTAFESNMAGRLAAQQHSYASLFRKNNDLVEENAKLEAHVELLQERLVEAYEEISKLKSQVKTKSDLKVVK